MAKMIFVNLPVTDLQRSMRFYGAVGAANEPKFTNQAAAMMRFSEEVNVMLLTHDFWRTFTSKTIPDARTTAQVLLCLSADRHSKTCALLWASGIVLLVKVRQKSWVSSITFTSSEKRIIAAPSLVNFGSLAAPTAS